MIINIIFWISTFLILHTYLGYPLLVLFIDHFVRKRVKLSEEKYTPFVSVIMAVHNEEAVIRKKMESLFSSEYPDGRIEVLVGSDSSDDSTEHILDSLQAIYPRLTLIKFS